jgi:hypothetical protein
VKYIDEIEIQELPIRVVSRQRRLPFSISKKVDGSRRLGYHPEKEEKKTRSEHKQGR